MQQSDDRKKLPGITFLRTATLRKNSGMGKLEQLRTFRQLSRNRYRYRYSQIGFHQIFLQNLSTGLQNSHWVILSLAASIGTEVYRTGIGTIAGLGYLEVLDLSKPFLLLGQLASVRTVSSQWAPTTPLVT